MTDEPAVYDHYRLTEGADAGAVFRVVGVDGSQGSTEQEPSISAGAETDEQQVTILRLTDADGNREATGDLRHVRRDRLARAFTPADDPDPRFEKPDYLAGLMLLGGAAFAAHPAGDRVAGAIMAVGGGYLLWRRY